MEIHYRRIVMLLAHAALAVTLLIWVADGYRQRQAEVAELSQRERLERIERDDRQHQLSVQRARLDGLDEQDPYVVELIAREKFGYRAPGEIKPPPMPADD